MTQNVRLERPWGNGRIVWTRDATANDSDKTFTVPTQKIWDLQAIFVEIVTTATVGNRSLCIIINNATPAAIWAFRAPAAIVASKYGDFALSFGSNTGATWGSTAIRRLGDIINNVDITGEGGAPRMLLTEGFSIRVLDGAVVDAAADDMTVILHYIEYDA